jgi:hypothetical protein
MAAHIAAIAAATAAQAFIREMRFSALMKVS